MRGTLRAIFVDLELLIRMCGIVGILGRGPVAEQLVDSLKRLEYRGYDSAGVATLEGDASGAPPRRRQAAQSRSAPAGVAAVGPYSASGTRAGPPTASRPRTTRIRMPPTTSPWFTTASSRIFANCAKQLEEKGAKFYQRNRHRSRRCIWSIRYIANGSSPAEAVKEALPQLRGAFALGVCVQGR